MRIKRTYTTRLRFFFWTGVFGEVYMYFHPDLYNRLWYDDSIVDSWWRLDYKEFKKRERYRWSEYLKNWDPVMSASYQRNNMGYLSNSVLDKWAFGKRRFQDPPTYDESADHFIAVAEASGLDPCAPLMESIKKTCDYYYPSDLDPNLDELKEIKKPEYVWIHKTDFEDFVEEEEKKPQPNTIARYLWFIPGYQEFNSWVREKAREQEENLLMAMNKFERQEYYENLDRMSARWALELNDYAPLLAKRWDHKIKFAKYMIAKENQNEIYELLMDAGGTKQLFINAGIIHPEPLSNNDQVETCH